MRWLALPGLFVAAASPVAHAHGDGLPISPAEVAHHWNFSPWIVVPMLLVHWLYGRGVGRAWRRAGRGRIVAVWQTACFLIGEVVLVVALISPVDPLGETLLSAHMLQHILLTAVAPPLLVLGAPVTAWIWAMPKNWRAVGSSAAVRVVVRISDRATRPVMAVVIHAVVIWLWHAPGLFNAALESEWLHTLEHVTFLASALMFWTAVCRRETPVFAAAGIVLLTFMHGGMLGGVLTLAPMALYDWYGNRSLLWGLTPLQDQQVAGLSMWVAAGAVYLSVFAWLAMRVAGVSSASPKNGIIRASTSSRSTK